MQCITARVRLSGCFKLHELFAYLPGPYDHLVHLLDFDRRTPRTLHLRHTDSCPVCVSAGYHLLRQSLTRPQGQRVTQPAAFSFAARPRRTPEQVESSEERELATAQVCIVWVVPVISLRAYRTKGKSGPAKFVSGIASSHVIVLGTLASTAAGILCHVWLAWTPCKAFLHDMRAAFCAVTIPARHMLHECCPLYAGTIVQASGRSASCV